MITENNNISFKELFENQLVELTVDSTKKKNKASKKILKAMTVYDQLNNAI